MAVPPARRRRAASASAASAWAFRRFSSIAAARAARSASVVERRHSACERRHASCCARHSAICAASAPAAGTGGSVAGAGRRMPRRRMPRRRRGGRGRSRSVGDAASVPGTNAEEPAGGADCADRRASQTTSTTTAAMTASTQITRSGASTSTPPNQTDGQSGHHCQPSQPPCTTGISPTTPMTAMPTHGGIDDAADQPLEVDASFEVGKQQPRGRVQQHEGCAEDRDDHHDAAHDDRVDADARGESGADAAEPALPAGHAKAAEPAEEAGTRSGPVVARGLGNGIGLVRLHASMLPTAAGAPPWGGTLSGP